MLPFPNRSAIIDTPNTHDDKLVRYTDIVCLLFMKKAVVPRLFISLLRMLQYEGKQYVNVTLFLLSAIYNHRHNTHDNK